VKNINRSKKFPHYARKKNSRPLRSLYIWPLHSWWPSDALETTLVTRNEIQTEMGNSYVLELPGLLHGHQKLPCLKTSQWMTWHRCGATNRLADTHTHAIQYILLWLLPHTCKCLFPPLVLKAVLECKNRLLLKVMASPGSSRW